jgi:hypothetical protein
MGKYLRVQVSPRPQRVGSVHRKYEEQRRQGSQSEPVSGPCDMSRVYTSGIETTR